MLPHLTFQINKDQGQRNKHSDLVLIENLVTNKNTKPKKNQYLQKAEQQWFMRDFKSMPTLLENYDYDKCLNTVLHSA